MEAERDVRSIRVWAGLSGLHGTVVEDVTISNEGDVIVAVRPGWRQRDRCGLCRLPAAVQRIAISPLDQFSCSG